MPAKRIDVWSEVKLQVLWALQAIFEYVSTLNLADIKKKRKVESEEECVHQQLPVFLSSVRELFLSFRHKNYVNHKIFTEWIQKARFLSSERV